MSEIMRWHSAKTVEILLEVEDGPYEAYGGDGPGTFRVMHVPVEDGKFDPLGWVVDLETEDEDEAIALFERLKKEAR